jgi:two-component system, cell cycle sensor histidine kinase and response regulator CckA
MVRRGAPDFADACLDRIPAMQAADALKLAIDNHSEGIQILDDAWHYVYLNHAAAAHGKSSVYELLGRRMTDCFPGLADTPLWRDLNYVLESGNARRIESEFTYPDGERRWFELHIERHAHGVLIRSLDVTERKRMEGQLRQAQRMETIRRMTAAIAHEFNNKLSIVLMSVQMARETIAESNPETARELSQAIAAARGATDLVQRLQSLARKPLLNPCVFDPGERLTAFQAELETLFGARHPIRLNVCEPAPFLYADPSALDDALLHLCTNARDALPEGGPITIEVAPVTLTADFPGEPGPITPGPFLLIEVKDAGVGMDRATLEQIFEPFFTTRADRGHAGLGLSIVQGFVHQSNGYIRVDSEPGQGSTIRMYLPAGHSSAAPALPSPPPARVVGGSETILLVDDETPLRQALAATLESAGYTVLPAGDAREAEQLFGLHRSRIQLLFTDILLGDRPGDLLAAALKELAPELKVLYMSGSVANFLKSDDSLKDGYVLIHKPSLPADILRTVRDVLDGRLHKGII